jgi:ABC-type uncharacterized transport system involved in gliding motility auxiliary subunit
VIGIVQGHDEPKLEEKLTHLRTVLSEMYEVRPVDLSSAEKVDPSVDALWVVGPKTAFKPNELKAIDQFLMEGKSAAFFLDAVQVDPRTFAPTEAEHGLGAFLETWGVKVGDKLVADAQSAQLNVQEQRGFMMVSMPVPYPFIPVLQRLEGDNPITRGLANLSMPFSTEVTLQPQAAAMGAVLAKSSPKSWLEAKPYKIDPRRDWRSETVAVDGSHPLMVQLNGKLKSHYDGTESKADARIIVAGGSALLQDQFMSRTNQALLLNVADWMLMDPALLAMRSRGLAEAPLKAEIAESTRNTVKFGNAFGIPLLLAAFGLVRWRMREASRREVLS